MPGLPMLPATAPFPAEQIAALNGVIAGTSAEQRSWLSGFLAGYQVAGEPAVPAQAGAPKVPLTILFGTESGNAETLAAQVRKSAGRLGFAAKVVDTAESTPQDAASAKNLLVIASTWGEGEPPQRAADFYAALMADDAPRFEGVRYAVLALGDSAYVNFCETGRRIDERLAELGGERIVPRIECDLDFETAARAWIDTSLATLAEQSWDAGGAVIHVEFGRAVPEEAGPGRSTAFDAGITELINLNGSRSSKETFHVELSLEGSGLTYEPGDSLGILPVNDPAVVASVLTAVGLDSDDGLHGTLAEQHDVTTLSRPLVQAYAELTSDGGVADLLQSPDRLAAFLPGRQPVDLFEAFPHKLTGEQLTGLLRPLPPRLYSIASSRKAVPDEAHLLIAAVRYDSFGRNRSGVASTYVADRRKVGDRLRVHVKPNRFFRLPADPAAPVIMVGPGTGVAPFRAFMQEREAIGATGRNWLFFGDRSYTHDFLYQLEWQDLLATGLLTRLDVAFSRDQQEKVYVQHRMWERRRDIHAWLEDGAFLYVCGDEKQMAKDVHRTLVSICADQAGRNAEWAEARVADLRRQGRYLRDVY